MSSQRPTLALSLEKATAILLKVREFHADVEEPEPGAASAPVELTPPAVLTIDPIVQELAQAVSALGDEERVDLIALISLGRGDYLLSEWADARAFARRFGVSQALDTLLGMPMVGEYLAEGLQMHGYRLKTRRSAGFPAPRDNLQAPF